MRRYGRADQTLVTLFLSDFAVPLPQLRRAWLTAPGCASRLLCGLFAKARMSEP
jgi:hypothetical protein